MKIYVDATTLIALGEVGKRDLLPSFDGRLCVLKPVENEVTREPAKGNLRGFTTRNPVSRSGLSNALFPKTREEEAKRILGEARVHRDVAIVSELIQIGNDGSDLPLVSDDRRLRTVAEGLGARVTGTIGVVVRAVAEGDLTEQEAKDLVRRLDSRGLHMTGELRGKADELIEEAARENDHG